MCGYIKSLFPRLILQGLLALVVTCLVACGGSSNHHKSSSSSSSSSSVSSASSMSSSDSSSSSSSSSTSAVSTDYVVRVYSTDLGSSSSAGPVKPSQKTTAAKTYSYKTQATDLGVDNFKVVIVDLAGNIVEEITLTPSQVTQRDDGSYSINVPGVPRLDCVIIADPSQPVVLPTTGSLFDTNLLLAPTAGTELDVDIGTTAAYSEFLNQLGGEGTFESIADKLNVEDASQLQTLTDLIKNVQQVIEEQVFTGLTFEEAKAAIKASVTDIIAQEVENINSQIESTLASAFSTEGGIHWYEGLTLGEIFRGDIVGDQDEAQFKYDGSQFVAYSDDSDNPDLILGSLGWQLSSQNIHIAEVNDDGSVDVSDNELDENVRLVKAAQAYDLAGRSIPEFFKANTATKALVGIVNPSAVFPTNAKGFRISITTTTDLYRLWYTAGDPETGLCKFDPNKNASNYGGNCNTLNGQTPNSGGFWDYNDSFTSLAALLSTDVALGSEGSKLISISWLGDASITVQLVDNETKTAHYFVSQWTQGGLVNEPLGDGSWSYITLPGLEGDAAQAITLDIPADIASQGNFDGKQPHVLFALNEGFVRQGSIELAGEIEELGSLIFNGTAADAINAAADYVTPLVGTWTRTNEQDNLVTVTALDNTHWLRIVADDGANCGSGFALNYYSLGLDNKLRFEPIYADIGSCALGGSPTVSIDVDSLSLSINGTATNFTRLVNDGIVGSWRGESDDGHLLLLSLMANGKFILAQYGDTEPDGTGHPGYELGSYSYNPDTGAFTPTVEFNQDGDWGLSSNSPNTTYSLSLDGDSLMVSFDDGLDSGQISFTRVGN